MKTRQLVVQMALFYDHVCCIGTLLVFTVTRNKGHQKEMSLDHTKGNDKFIINIYLVHWPYSLARGD